MEIDNYISFVTIDTNVDIDDSICTVKEYQEKLGNYLCFCKKYTFQN